MAVSNAHVFPGFLTPVLTQLSFQSHQLLFSHSSAEVRGEKMPKRKFAFVQGRNEFKQFICQVSWKLGRSVLHKNSLLLDLDNIRRITPI